MADLKGRRELLARTDSLLERVEDLRLRGLLRVPEAMRAELYEAAFAAGDQRPVSRPLTLTAAHRYLFQLQEPLLGGEQPAQIRRQVLQQYRGHGRATIRHFALPAREVAESDATWLEDVRLVLQRAQDAARFLRAQAQVAARVPGAAGRRLCELRSDQARAAAGVFDRLLQRAEQISGVRPPHASPPTMPGSGALRVADLHIDIDRGEVRHGHTQMALSPLEHQYLVALVANAGRVMTRESLMQLVHGDDPWVELDSRAIDVHVYHLRQKLCAPPYLRTVPGIGYQIDGVAADQELMRDQRREQRRAYAREHRAALSDSLDPLVSWPAAEPPAMDRLVD